MLDIILGHQVERFATVMEKVWRFRHRCFVEELGWEGLRTIDGRERDAFDTADTIHLVLREGHHLIGYSRLLPTTKPHLLSDPLAFLVPNGRYPKTSSAFEWGRCAALRNMRSKDGILASDLLMTGVLEYAVSFGIEAFVIEATPLIIRMLQRRGYVLDFLGPPSLHEGHWVLAVVAYPSPELLQQHRKRHGVRLSLLRVFDDVDLHLTSHRHVQCQQRGERRGTTRQIGDGSKHGRTVCR
ncbi:acyl-homoserine-lactone synthase [Neorhizobium sp. NCHU2750]|uniref:acyl-homoserine-lactone synthase n=1 Tax=Neorhizobium sp. NCHU2750 TaxID=1825976 RepID=UPI000E73E321|nr:hypothetical protein NCHU2750_12520 [Neorhizobium sp. NCHU2750]